MSLFSTPLPPNAPPAKLLPEREIGPVSVRHCGVSMTTIPATNEQSAAPRYQRLRRLALLATVWIVLLTLSACVFRVGVQLRHWAWTQTENMHFQGDATHAYIWGTYADRNGLLGMYRQIRSDYGDQPPQNMGLDYSPLRLTIVTLWAQWVNRHFSDGDQWDPSISYEFHRPLLLVNAACEAAAAVGVLLVLRLMRRIVMPSADWCSGVLEPAAQISAPGPCRVIGLVQSRVDFERLLAAMGRLDIALLHLRALFFDARLVVQRGHSPGSGRDAQGSDSFRRPGIRPLAAVFNALAAPRASPGGVCRCTYPFRHSLDAHRQGRRDPGLHGAAVAAALLIFRKGWRRPVFQLLAAAAFVVPVWLTPRITTGDLSWFVLPFEYGPVKHTELSTVGTSNLGALLHEQWGWEADTPVDLPLPFGHDLQTDLRTVLVSLYAICLVVCGIAAAVQWRRRDWRFLLAMYAPWVLFFALMPYLNNRYLLWASAFFPLLIPLGLGMTLLGGLICLSCCAMLVEIMCRFNPGSDPILQSVSRRLYPGLAYLVLLIAAILLYNAAIFRQSKRPA